jgi:hypothetical protein
MTSHLLTRVQGHGGIRYWLLFCLWALNFQIVWAQSSLTPQQATSQLNALAPEVVFERNVGQHEDQYHYVAKDRQATYFFMKDEVRASVSNAQGDQSFSYGMRFLHASASARPIGLGRSQGQQSQLNVIQGASIIKDVPMHRELRYPALWNNIHAMFYSSSEGLKYDFKVLPGGNPADIRFAMEGVTNLRVTASGELTWSTPFGELVKGRPYTYQTINGQVVEVPCSYVVENNQVSFQVGQYDTQHELIIDPVALKWATILGGSTNFRVYDMRVDAENRKLYLVGYESGLIYPATSGIPTLIIGGNDRAFVMCMPIDGSSILWKTEIRSKPGTNTYGKGIELDDDGNIYVITLTHGGVNVFDGISPEVPGVKMNHSVGTNIMPALFKLNPEGNELKYFSYLMDTHSTHSFSYDTENLHFPMVIDNEGRVVYIAKHRHGRSYTGIYNGEFFMPRSNHAFGLTEPTTGDFYLINTIDTRISGPAGLVNCGLMNGTATGLEKDGAGNIYLTGLLWDNRFVLRAQYGKTTGHYPFFTHQTQNLEYLQNGGDAYPLYLVKFNPDQSQVLHGSLIGQERAKNATDYFEGSYEEDLVVTSDGDVYLGTIYYAYPNNAYDTSYLANSAYKQTILTGRYDPGCRGYCFIAQVVEKYPASSLHQAEWLVQY